jgi:CheY-like chemotaxis protein
MACVWPPDIFLSDVMMPGRNGIEAAILICKTIPKCHVLLFSGSNTTGDLILDARARGYEFEILAKPIHPSDLLARLRDILA